MREGWEEEVVGVCGLVGGGYEEGTGIPCQVGALKRSAIGVVLVVTRRQGEKMNCPKIRID